MTLSIPTRTHLETLGVAALLDGPATTPEQERSVIRRSFLKQALAHHPDKGGDAELFQALHEAFEALQQATGSWTRSIQTVQTCEAPRRTNVYAAAAAYETAADLEEPGYRIEVAPTGRATCVSTGEVIEKGTLRAGSLDPVSGSYARNSKLSAWRVPACITACVKTLPERTPESVAALLTKMDGIVLCGVGTLSPEHLATVAEHVADEAHWAKLNVKTAALTAKVTAETPAAPAKGSAKAPAETPASTALAIPDLTVPDALKGEVVVLTGIFDDAGGGSGFKKGKGGVKAMVQKAGAKVTTSITGKTTILLVGRLPGGGKISEANARGVNILDLDGLHARLLGDTSEREACVGELSAGFGGNGKRLTGPSDEPKAKRVKTAESEDEEAEWARAEAEWEVHRREKVERYKALRADGKRFYEIFGAEHGFYWLTTDELAEFLARPTTSDHEETKLSTSFGAETNRGKRPVDEVDKLLAEGVEVDIDDRWWKV